MEAKAAPESPHKSAATPQQDTNKTYLMALEVKQQLCDPVTEPLPNAIPVPVVVASKNQISEAQVELIKRLIKAIKTL